APVVTAEIGGLPPEAVAATFQQAQDKIFGCFKKGLERVNFIGGSVRFFVKVDLKGKFMHAHLEKSDLGDRATEQCLLDVLMGYKWQTPVGGKVGIATFEMSFDHAPDVRQPTAWSADRVKEVLAAKKDDLEECRGGVTGTYTATVYIEATIDDSGTPEPATPAKGKKPVKEDKEHATPKTRGRAITASATPPDEAGEMAIDCIVGILKDAVYPDP